MRNAVPSAKRHRDISKALRDAFSTFLLDLYDESKMQKGLTLIVLTDGLWVEMGSKNEAQKKIIKVIEDLRGKIDSF